MKFKFLSSYLTFSSMVFLTVSCREFVIGEKKVNTYFLTFVWGEKIISFEIFPLVPNWLMTFGRQKKLMKDKQQMSYSQFSIKQSIKYYNMLSRVGCRSKLRYSFWKLGWKLRPSVFLPLFTKLIRKARNSHEKWGNGKTNFLDIMKKEKGKFLIKIFFFFIQTWKPISLTIFSSSFFSLCDQLRWEREMLTF